MHIQQIQYHVAIKKRKESKYQVLNNPDNAWAADPFLFSYKGEMYIFAEIWKYNLGEKGRGVIGFCKYSEGKVTEWTEVIRESYHLSYPYIFSYGNNIYICPESGDSGEIYLYRAIDFPYKWEKCISLYDGGAKCVDSTFFKYKGDIFGFTYCITNENADNCNELWLFKVDNKKICFCDNNPLTVKKEHARCAGKVINNFGDLIRVSQDCDGGYGLGVVLNTFSIDPEYNETVIKTIYPKDIILNKKYRGIGVHTYNVLNDYEVSDIKTKEVSIRMLWYRLENRVKRRFGDYEK